MAKNLCSAAGFSTLKNQPYDLIEHSEAGFNTEIDWNKFTALETEPQINIYDDDINIISAINVSVMGSGLTGYMIQVTEDDSMYAYTSQDMTIEEAGLSFVANTWLYVDMSAEDPSQKVIPQIPEVFEIDPEAINSDYQTIFDEILGKGNISYQPITLEEEVNVDLKDKTYETVADQGAKFKEIIDWTAFSDLENGNYLLYGVDMNTPEFPSIMLAKTASLCMITYTLDADISDPTKQIAYGYSSVSSTMDANKWYYINSMETPAIIRPEVPQIFEFENEKILDQSHFEAICDIVDFKISLKTNLDNRINAINNAVEEAITDLEERKVSNTTLVGGINLINNSEYLNEHKVLISPNKQYGIYLNKKYRVKESFTEAETYEILTNSQYIYWYIQQYGNPVGFQVYSIENKKYLEFTNSTYNLSCYYDYDNNTWKITGTDEPMDYEEEKFTFNMTYTKADFYTLSKILIPLDNSYGDLIAYHWDTPETEYIFSATLNDDIDIDTLVDGLTFTKDQNDKYEPIELFNADNNLVIKVYKDNLFDDRTDLGNYEITVTVNGYDYYLNNTFREYSYYYKSFNRNNAIGGLDENIINNIWYRQAWSHVYGRLGIYPTCVISKDALEHSQYKDKIMMILRKIDTNVFNKPKELKDYLKDKFDSISQLPACPTDTDGTYVLEATVADGEVTYTWVLKSS